MFVRFKGSIVPVQPITVSVPGKEGATVHTFPIRDESGQRSVRVGLTGHNIKGALRSVGGSGALADMLGARIGEGKGQAVLSLTAFSEAKHGGLMGANQRSIEDVIELRSMRARNVHMALFGSMPLAQTSRVHIDNAYSDDEIGRRNVETDPLATTYSARRDVFRQDPGLLNDFPEDEVDGYFDEQANVKEVSALRKRVKVLDQEKTKLLRIRENWGETEKLRVKAIDAEKDKLAKDVKKKLKEDGGESVGRTLDPYDTIAPGVVLNHEMRLVGVNDLEFGYFLLALKHFAYGGNGATFGGRNQTGNGQATMRYDVMICETGFDDVPAGRLVIGPRSYKFETAHPAVARALKAIDEARKNPAAHFDTGALAEVQRRQKARAAAGKDGGVAAEGESPADLDGAETVQLSEPAAAEAPKRRGRPAKAAAAE
jgi:hypothetical protein